MRPPYVRTIARPVEADVRGVLDYWNLIRRRKWLVTFLVLVGTVIGALLTLSQTPLYRARTSLEIQSSDDVAAQAGMEGRERVTLSETAMQSYLQTQVVILESRTFKKRVTTKLTKDKPHAFYTMDSLSGWQQVFGINAEDPPERKVQSGFPPLEVEVRVVPNTRIIEIAVDSPDPAFSADFANGMANEFLGYNLEARWDASKRTTDWLTGQLETFRSALKVSEDRLQEYRRQSGLTTNDGEERSLEEEKLRQIQEELSHAEGARIAGQSFYDLAQSTSIDTLPEVADNPRLSQYATNIADLRRQLAQLSADFTPTHPNVQAVLAQIKVVEATMESERKNVLARIGNQFEAARRREDALNRAYQAQLGVVSNQASKMANYSLLKREVDTNRSLYDTLLGKMKEAGITAAASSSDSRIVDTATAPTRPYKPSIYLNTAAGFLLGFFLSVGVVLLRDQLDATYRAPGESIVHLQLPELGVIPSEKAAAALEGNRRLFGFAKSTGGEVIGVRPKGKDGRIELATWKDAPSILAESFRNVMTSILRTPRTTDKGRLLLVTSACRHDGKTTSVANLAIALAEIGQKVLVIDADMRRPRLHDLFEVPLSPGLSDCLVDSDHGTETQRIAHTQVEGLDLLPAGRPPGNISRLLHSPRVIEMLDRLQKEYDVILIDTPPLLSMPDARVLGLVTESTILVVRAGKTPRDLALAAKHRLMEDGIPLLGSILVAWDGKGRAQYGAESYHSPYYARTDGNG